MDKFKEFRYQQDSQIWEEVRRGNRAALSFIYEHYASYLFNYGLKISSDRELLNDSIQEVFVNIWRYRKNICTTNSIKNYLFTSFRREVIRRLKSQNINIPLDFSPEESVISIEEQFIFHEEDNMRKDALSRAILLLPKRQKEIVHLKYIHNLSYSEIASTMNLDTKSVYKLLYKALNRLQKIIHTSVSV